MNVANEMPLNLRKEEFTEPRTPHELSKYVKHVYQSIAEDRDLKKLARLHKEPYKTFLEELIPFSHFCTWKYGEREDVQCALVCGTPGRDAVVIDKKTGLEHSVEITWPIDGHKVVQQNKLMTERTYSNPIIWDSDDLSQHDAAIDKIIKIAKKKALRDYRDKGGSTIIFVFDSSLFWDDNQEHIEHLKSLKDKLSRIPLMVDAVLLMIILGERKKIIDVKKTEEKS